MGTRTKTTISKGSATGGPVDLNRYLSRKFLLALATVASATWLVYADHIADGVYSAVVIATVTAYFASNVTQKVLVTSDSTTTEIIEE